MPKVQASGGAGRVRGRRVATSLAEINVVPLVDVMLVLLIIFMVAAPMMQQGLTVALPQSRKSPPVTGADPVYVTVSLTHARTIVSNLLTVPDQPVEDAKALQRLAIGCLVMFYQQFMVGIPLIYIIRHFSLMWCFLGMQRKSIFIRNYLSFILSIFVSSEGHHLLRANK